MADLSVKDEERLRKVELQCSEAQGGFKTAKAFFWSVSGLFVGLIVLGISGIVYLSMTIGALQESSGQRKEDLTRFEKTIQQMKADTTIQRQEDLARLEKALQKLEGRLLIPAPVSYSPMRYHEHFGKISRITKESLTLEYKSDKAKWELTIQIATGARVLIKGKPAQVSDLKPGMNVSIVHREGGLIELIEVIEEKDNPTPVPLPIPGK